MTKTRNLANLGGGFIQAGTGAVQRTVESKLQDTVSVKDFGAVGDGVTDDTAAIQAAIDAANHVVFPAGTYSINNAITISNVGTTVEGLGTVEILQQAYPQHVFFITASNCSIKGLKLTGVPTKALLSESLATRYYGDTQRVKSSAIYCYGSDNVNVSNCQFKKFVTGVFLKGGDDISWVANDGQGSRMTSTTFALNAADSQVDDYWNGAYIRILTNDGSYGPARISDYDSTTNTVTFTTATTAITLTGSNQWNYILIKGRSKDLVIRDNSFDLIDFGISGANVENLTIEDCIYETIEQTQQTNVRPHSIYLTGGDNRNVRASSLMTYSCQDGQAYKFLAVDGLFLSDLDSYDSKGAAAIEGCRNVTGNNLTCLLSGGTNASGPEIVQLTASEKVYLTNLRLSLHPDYNQTASEYRPVGVDVAGSDDIGRGDTGTMLGVNPLQVSEVYISNIVVDAGASYTGTVYGCLVLGTATRPVIDSTFDSVALVDGDNCIYQPFRSDYCDNIAFRNPTYDATPTSSSVQLGANCSNTTALLLPDKSAFTFADTGSNNTLIYSTPFTRGTWTPTIVGGTIAGSNTYANQIGDWMRVGDLVYVTGRVTLTNLASTGNITISGLPYASDNFDASSGAGYFQGGNLGDYSNVNFTSVPVIRIPRNSTSVRLSYQGTTGVSEVTHAELTNTTAMMFSFSYKALPLSY
jgi:hypothetical protein